MMRYSIKGNSFRVMRITGPAHNLLGLSFSQGTPGAVVVEKLASSPERTIDEDQLREAVLSGVDAANASHETNYHVSRIQYVPTDTPDLGIYSLLARRIIERLATGVNYEGG